MSGPYIGFDGLSARQRDEVVRLIKTALEEASAKTVADLHRRSDKDHRTEALHHSLGMRDTQASPGNHNHDGGNSVPLLNDVFVGSRTAYNATLFNSVMDSLVKLGATNNTTP